MPLQGGVCAYDPEHTPLPQDLDDPELPDWLPEWLHNYQRRDAWRHSQFGTFGPLPPLHSEDISVVKLGPVPAIGARGLPALMERHPGNFTWHQKPLCAECFMPLEQGICPLQPSHDVSQPPHLSEAFLQLGAEQDGVAMARAAPFRVSLSAPLDCSNKSEFEQETSAVAPSNAAAPTSVASLEGRQSLQCVSVLDDHCLPTSIEGWLREVDPAGFLAPYHDVIAGHFDSPAQIIDVYVQSAEDGQQPSFNSRFLDDMQVLKLGHRRLFEKWFATKLGVRCGESCS